MKKYILILIVLGFIIWFINRDHVTPVETPPKITEELPVNLGGQTTELPPGEEMMMSI